MDPQTLWQEICDIVNSPVDTSYDSNPELYGEFYDKMRDLSGWLEKGGFSPVVDLETDILKRLYYHSSSMDFALHCNACGHYGQSFRIVRADEGYKFLTYHGNGEFKFETQLRW